MYDEAKNKFDQFIKLNFDVLEPKIIHKLNHTFHVVDNAEYICKELNLNYENIELAKLIALLHDFGRFDQAKQYKSFREDLGAADHAFLGVKLLFDHNLIRTFIDDNKYDKIIKCAISNHSKYNLDITGMSDKECFHSKIIRDADKLDSFRAKSLEDVYTMANITTDEIEKSLISDNIFNDFMNEKAILSKDRKTGIDIWISYVAFIFDLNFKPSLKFVKDKNYVNILIDRFNYINEDTKIKMEKIRDKANSYINYMY